MTGVDVIIGVLLLAFQGLVLLVLAAQAAFGRRWVAGSGLLAGFAIGLAPMIAAVQFDLLPRIFNLFNTPLVLLSSTVLIVSYGFARRWIAFGLVIAIFFMPLSWFFFRSESLKILTPLEVPLGIISDFDFYFAPIACALAGQEIFVWARRRAANSKEGMA